MAGISFPNIRGRLLLQAKSPFLFADSTRSKAAHPFIQPCFHKRLSSLKLSPSHLFTTEKVSSAQSQNTGGRKDIQAALSLVELSEVIIIRHPEMIFAELAERGCVLRPPTEPWRPLSGGLEYNHYVADPISVDEVTSTLLVEILRTARPDESWVNNFELRASDPSQLDWVEKIRDVLVRDFKRETSSSAAAEVFTRGLSRCLLVHASASESARLLLTTQSKIRNL